MSALKNISLGSTSKSKTKVKSGQSDASAKDLQKLRRMDLLELLIDQVRDNEKLSASVTELAELSERLKAKLDDKDAQIERLKAKLDDKDAQIAELQENNRAMAHAVNTLDIDEIMAVQRHALSRYFKYLTEEKDADGTVSDDVEKNDASDAVSNDDEYVDTADDSKAEGDEGLSEQDKSSEEEPESE